jgi:Cytochrome c/c1 heme lyase
VCLLTGIRENEKPYLIEFKGRPGQPTPKSRFLYWTGCVPKAFDHHEWLVSTGEPGGTRKYVIDYYGLDDLTFSVDARPAVDNFASLRARALNLFDSLKAKALGEPKKDDKVTKFDTE